MNDCRYVHVIAEGPTEDIFLNSVVLPYLKEKSSVIQSCKVTNFNGVGRTESEGYNRMRRHIVAAILSYINKERHVEKKPLFTTFIDYYRFPKAGIPQYAYTKFPDVYQQVCDRQNAFRNAILSEQKLSGVLDKFEFRPFLMLHETETLIFVDPGKLDGIVTTRKAIIKDLVKQACLFSNVEEINDNYYTSPKHRIEIVFSDHNEVYHEKTHTPLVAKAIGMPVLIDACKHFGDWINMLCENKWE